MQRRATPEDAGARLDAFLAAPLGSRARAQRLIEAGLVLVDGRAAPKRHLLSAGELVTVDEPEEAPAPDGGRRAVRACPTPTSTCWWSTSPPASSCTPRAGTATGTLAQALSAVAAGGEDAARAGIVHRLDRDTSGLLVVARSEAVHRRCATRCRRARSRASTSRWSRAGRPRAAARSTRRWGATGGCARGCRPTPTIRAAAVTHFELERALPRTTLLRVRLETGRTHQIRAHLQAIEHPVVGDPEYGTPGRLGLERQFLHAARLAFAHPVTGAPIDVSSPLPDDLAGGAQPGRRRVTHSSAR